MACCGEPREIEIRGALPPPGEPERPSRHVPPAPRIMLGTVQLLDMIRTHYDNGFGQSEEAVQRRLVARSLCRAAGLNPETIVVRGPVPAGPKGSVPIENIMPQAMPLWCLFWSDAECAMRAAEAAKDGKELEDDQQLQGPAEAVDGT